MYKLEKKAPYMRHIALYIGSLQQGGAERVMSSLAEYLWEKGWKVTLVTTYFNPPEYMPEHGAWDPQTGTPLPGQEGIQRIYSDLTPGQLTHSRIRNFLARFNTLRRIWKRIRPDIILSFIGMNNIMAILTSRGLHIPVAISVRANPPVEYASPKLMIPALLLFGRADALIMQTTQGKLFFPRYIQKKAVLLPNALSPDFIRPVYEGERTKRIVCVGRLDENKNQAMVMEAFKDAGKGEKPEQGEQDKYPARREWTLELYGDGPCRQELETLAKQLGMEDRIVFFGTGSHIADRIRTASVFVLSSDTEGMPNALMEAMSLGLACISTDCPCGGPADLIQDGVNGYLIPVRDEEALRVKLQMLMDDPALAGQIGKEASRIQQLYSPDVICSRWEQTLEALC